MLGQRGVRLYLTRPDIVQMQVRAILEAACNKAKEGVDVLPRIMIPMVSHHRELEMAKELLLPVARQVMAEKGVEIDCRFGVMIETPRAALTAGQVAEQAEFFNFGSGDLTKMTFGMNRDDAERSFLLRAPVPIQVVGRKVNQHGRDTMTCRRQLRLHHRGHDNLKDRPLRHLAVLNRVKGSLKIVEVATRANQFNLCARATAQLQGIAQGQVYLGCGAAHSITANALLELVAHQMCG